MKNTVIKFGLIGGVIISVFMFSTMPFMDENSDMSNAKLIGYTTMVLSMAPMFFGIKNYRDKKLGGSITFGKAFLMGLYISLITATMYVLSWMIISDVYLPDFMDNYVNIMVEQMQASGKTQIEIDAELESMKEMMERYKNPLFKVLITYAEILIPVGVLIPLISALILKKK